MAKKTHLNSAVTRFKFNQKPHIGDINGAISLATPLTEQEWSDFYFQNVKSESELDRIGSELYRKISDVVLPEISSITEEDCKEYMRELVIKKSFEGHRTRYIILNSELIKKTGKDFRFLPDYPNDYKFRTYAIDYYHLDETKDLLIGIKVQPFSITKSQEPHVKKALQEIQQTHKEWEDKEAGRFFILYYSGAKENYTIHNEEILEEIVAL